MTVPLVRRIDDRRRRHDTHFKIRDAGIGKAKLCSGRARYVELALAPVRTGVVDAYHGGVAILRVADEENCAVGVDRTCGTIGFIRAKRFARRRQATRVVVIVPAVVIV